MTVSAGSQVSGPLLRTVQDSQNFHRALPDLVHRQPWQPRKHKLTSIRLATGAAHSAPKPAFSMTTEMAMRAFLFGAKAMNIEWFFP